MLGDITRKQSLPQKSVVSTKLKDAIIQALGEGRQDSPPSAGMSFRSSSIPYLCPRMYALALRDKFATFTNPDAALSWTFGTGTAFHTQFQEDYLQRLPGGVFQGWWRDRDTGVVHKGPSNDLGDSLSHVWIPRPTDAALGTDHEYVELEFYNEEYRLSGHCDGILVWPDGQSEVLEIKTINSRGFDFVDPFMGGKPKAEHVAQVQAYMWLSGVDKARIFYVKKDLTKGPADVMCEHLIERDDAIIDAIKVMLIECAAIVDAPEGSPVPDRLPDCRTKSSSKARWCVARDPCFAR